MTQEPLGSFTLSRTGPAFQVQNPTSKQTGMEMDKKRKVAGVGAFDFLQNLWAQMNKCSFAFLYDVQWLPSPFLYLKSEHVSNDMQVMGQNRCLHIFSFCLFTVRACFK